MRRQWRLTKWWLSIALSTLCLLLSFAQTTHAANPTTISFQGKVVNSNGTNVTDGTYNFAFKLYSAASGGTALWTETDSLTVTAGVFQVNLGASCSFFTAAACNSSTPIDFNANPALYLGITFNADPAGEMTPRVQLQSVPYAYNADKVGGLTASQFVQLSPGSAQSGFANLSGNVTSGATIQGVNVVATTGLSVNSGAFTVNSTGAITASTGLIDTGTATIQNATYTSNMVTINDGQTTAVPTIPSGYLPALTVVTAEVSGSRPLFFGYNTGASAFAAFLDAGACGAFTQMCFDLGNGTTSFTALENVGTTLKVGGGDDGNFTAVNIVPNTSISGTLGVTGLSTLSGGATVTGSVTATTSVITPSLTSSGALAISSGGATNVSIDTGATGGSVLIGGTNATAVGLSRTGQTTTVNGALTVTQTSTFNSNVTMTFTGANNLDISSDLAGNVNAINLIATPSATAGTTNGAFIQQANSANTNGLDNGLTIDNADTNLPIANAINITNTGGGGYTNLISSPGFTVAASGDIYGSGFDYFDPSALTGTSLLGTGGATGGNFGGAFASGAFIGNDSSYAMEFIASQASTTTNNTNFGDSGNWYNNTGGSTAGTSVATQTIATATAGSASGYVRMTTPTTTARGGLLTTGATPGTQDKPLLAANLPIIQMKIRPSILRVTDDVIWGIGDTAAAVATNDTLPTNGIVFWSNNSTGTGGWTGVVRSGGATIGTPVVCPGGITANAWATGRIVVVNATTVRFFIDVNSSDGTSFVDCGTVTGTMPTAAMGLQMNVIHTVATASTFDLDYARWWQDDAAPTDSTQASADTSLAQTQADIATGSDDPAIADPSNIEGTEPTITAPTDSTTQPSDLTTSPSPDGTTTQLADSSGTTQFSFDTNGNASLPGNLSLSSATVSDGLIVGGDINVAGLSTFQKLATFLAKTVFRQDVEIDGHLTVANDNAGYAKLRKDESSVHVTFAHSYDTPPVVSVSATDGQFIVVSVGNVTAQGFDIKLQDPAAADTTFSWTAVGVVNPQTATNLLPTAH